MMSEQNSAGRQIPAIKGWFTWPPSDEPHLIGSRCKSCGDYFFPKIKTCRNPKCMSVDIEEALLGRKGKLWSYTINYYKAPSPYVSPEPFVPYAIAVVELPKEKMKIQGQIVSGYPLETLKIGIDVELVIESLHKDAQGNDVLAWKWKPI